MQAIALAASPVPAIAPSFALTDLQGRVHTLAMYRGKWVLLNLWATWCAPCVAEMPMLQSLHDARADLAVIGLAVDGQDGERLSRFAAKLKISYPLVAGNMKAAQQFTARGYPTSILYNPAGQAVLVKEGALVVNEVLAAMEVEAAR